MIDVTIHDSQTAPPAARAFLDGAAAKFGFVPNLLGVMANSPQLLQAYLTLSELFGQTSLSPVEQQVVLLTVSKTNGCDYCVAAHCKLAKMAKVPEQVIAGILEGRAIDDGKLAALSSVTTQLVSTRGWPEENAVQGFLKAGYTSAQLLEVVLGVGMKTLSNYTNHLAHTPVDDAFQQSAGA